MFDIFFKRKKIVIDCFTTNVNAHGLFPIQRAARFYPEWWKQLPKSEMIENDVGLLVERPTIKSCSGINNLYQEGFVIPLWSDVVIQTRGLNYLFTFADGVSSLPYHNLDQLGSDFYGFLNVKFDSPWRIQEKTGVKFIFIQPSWNNPTDLFNSHALPGVIEFKHQHTSNINMLLSRQHRYQWDAGRPLAHVIPITDQDIEVKTHLVGEAETKTMQVFNQRYPFFLGSYKKTKQIMKGRCPF